MLCTAEKLRYYFKDCFKINGKETVKMPNKGIYIKFKNLRRKSKSQFMIHAGFESILVSEDNGKPNPIESYTNKHQKRIACSYDYKLVYVDDKFSKPFKSYSSKDTAYNYINSMVEGSKYCSDVMKKHFNKNL